MITWSGSNLLIDGWGDFPAGFVGTASGNTMAFTHYMHTLTCHLKKFLIDDKIHKVNTVYLRGDLWVFGEAKIFFSKVFGFRSELQRKIPDRGSPDGPFHIFGVKCKFTFGFLNKWFRFQGKYFQNLGSGRYSTRPLWSRIQKMTPWNCDFKLKLNSSVHKIEPSVILSV